MNIRVNVDAQFVAEVLEEFCLNHSCPTNCPFDKMGLCRQDNAFNTVLDRLNKTVDANLRRN